MENLQKLRGGIYFYHHNKISRIKFILLKYIFTGIASYVLYLALLVLQVEYFYISPIFASISAFIPSFFLSYALTSRWTFPFESTKNIAQLYKFTIVVAIGFFLNISIMYTATEMMDWGYMYSQVLVFIIVSANNFLFNRLWVFPKK
jgi:putative flippase GtrA